MWTLNSCSAIASMGEASAAMIETRPSRKSAVRHQVQRERARAPRR
jgi:hypothetical protein